MKLKFFKREKVENTIDENLMVVLPKSQKEVSIASLVNDADEAESKKPKDGEKMMANGDHHVSVGGKLMTVNELLTKHQAMCDALDAAKEGMDSAGAADEKKDKKDEKKENATELAATPKEKTKEELEGEERAEKLRIANENPPAAEPAVVQVMTLKDRVNLGKKRYGTK